MQENIKTLEAAKIQVAVVSYDSVESLKKFAEEKKITFAMLSDEKSKTIRAYGVFDEREEKGTDRWGHAYPVTFVVDRKSIVRGVLIGTTPKRHTVEELIQAVK